MLSGNIESRMFTFFRGWNSAKFQPGCVSVPAPKNVNIRDSIFRHRNKLNLTRLTLKLDLTFNTKFKTTLEKSEETFLKSLE